MAVSALVRERDGGQDRAIAGLLHDAIKDAGETAWAGFVPIFQPRDGIQYETGVQNGRFVRSVPRP